MYIPKNLKKIHNTFLKEIEAKFFIGAFSKMQVSTKTSVIVLGYLFAQLNNYRGIVKIEKKNSQNYSLSEKATVITQKSSDECQLLRRSKNIFCD